MSDEVSSPTQSSPENAVSESVLTEPRGEPLDGGAEIASVLAEIRAQRDGAIAARAEAEAIRAELVTVKTDLLTHCEAAKGILEEAQSQALLARSAVEQATAVHASLETSNSQSKEATAQALGALETLRGLAGTGSESAARIEALKAQVEQTAQVAAQRSGHIEEGRIYVDQKRSEIDVILNTAQKSANETDSQHQTAKARVESLEGLCASAQKIKVGAESTAATLAELKTQSEADAGQTTRLAATADAVDKRIKASEQTLTGLQEQSAERLRLIERLLPGAASAGLASAFLSRREQLKWPLRIWQAVFLASVLMLFAIAGLHTGPNGLEYGLFPMADTALTFPHLGLSLLYRLPFALPLIWLAFHASHRAALIQRVEEDYAFKEAVSRSFEGYRREMGEIEGKTGSFSALSALCEQVLGVIAKPPGRLFERHALNRTPLNALADSATPIAEAASKINPLVAN